MNAKKVLLVGSIVGAMAIGAMIGPMTGFAGTNGKPLFQGPQFSASSNTQQMGARMGQYFAGSMDDTAADLLGITVDELYQLRASGKSIQQIAEEKGVKLEDLTNQLKDAKRAQLEQLVKDGTISEEQMNLILERMDATIEEAITRTTFGYGNGMQGKGAMGAGMGQYFAGSMNDTIADVLGVTVDELYQLRASGKSIQQIAEEKGIKIEDLTSAVLEAKKEQLEQLVKDGTITEDQKNYMLERMEASIDEAITRTGYGPNGNGFGSKMQGKGPRSNQNGDFQPMQGRGGGMGGGPRWSK